jgi:hypothetical protein
MSAPGTFSIDVRFADFLSGPGGAAREILRKVAFDRCVERDPDKRSSDRVVAWCTVVGQRIGYALRRAGTTCECALVREH